MQASPKVLRKKQLQIAQNKVIRFTNFLGPRTRITADILSELNLLNVETRVKQLRLNHVDKIFYNLCPQYLKENFVPLNDVHQYNTRSSSITQTCPCNILQYFTVVKMVIFR